MSYKLKLIRLMEEKHKLLKKQFGLVPDYFTKEDEKAILSWDEDECERIWEKIHHYVFERGFYGLYSGCCPFCIKYEKEGDDLDCNSCEYAKTHGRCGDPESDWMKIPNKEGVPSLKWLKETFVKIDKED